MGGKKKNNRDKPADKDDTKDSKKQQQKPVSRGGEEEEEEGGSVPSPGGSPPGQHREEVTGRSHRTGSVPTVTYDVAQTVSGSPRASSVSGRPKIVRGADKQEDKGGDDLGTWGTFGGDHQDGSEEQDTASATSKKPENKKHRPAWVKKLDPRKPKKTRSSTDSTSSLTRDVRHDPMHAVAESGLEIEPGEWEGSCEDDDAPIPKPKQNPEEQSQESPDLVLSPSSGQDSSVFSVGSSDYVVLERPSVFDKKDRQNSITELVENRERAIQDTEANEREKLQNIERIKQAIQDTEAKEREKQQNIGRIRKADENIIEAAAKYKKQVTNLQSQLDAERLKNEQLAKEKQEADDALIRVCSVAPGGVEKSVKEQHDSLRSENEKLADRAHTAEATVVQLTQGMKELTVESKACEEQLKTQHKSDLEAEKRQKTAMLKSKVESHDAGLAKKEAELQSLKEKLENEEAKTVVVTKMIEEKDAEILALQSQADANKEVKAVEYNCLQKQIDVAMKQVAQNAHSAKQLDDLKKRWSHEEVRYEKDLQSIKDVNEAALKEKDAQMAEAKEQWGAEFQDLKTQLESMSAEVENYKQVSVEQKAAIELSKGDGGPASNYQDSSTDVGLPSHVIRFAHEVAKFVDKEFTPPVEIPHTELHPERVERILDIIGTDPVAKQKSYAFAVLPVHNKMHSVLLDFTGQLRMAEFQSLCALPPPGDIQGPPEAVASPQLTTENEDTNEPLPEEAEVVGEDLNKTDLQKTEGLQQKVDHLQKQLESSTAELTESQRSLKQAEDHVMKLTADLEAKTNEADELAAVFIATKPGAALADQDELEKLQKQLQEKEREIVALKTSLEHVPTADQQRKASTGSHAQELDSETEKVSRLEGLLRSEKSSRKKAEGKIEALEEHLRKPLSKTQPEQMNVSQQLLASQMQHPASDELSEEFSEREQQLEEEIESMKAAEADLLGTVRQLQAEVKAKNNLLQLTQSAQAGSEEDAFKKVKMQYLEKHMESIQLKEQLKQCESQHQPGALEVPMCVRSLSHEEASASGLSSSAQIEQLKIAIHMEKQKTGNLESTVRAFESTAQEHKRLKEHQTVQSKKILELIKELAEAKSKIAHHEEELHALQGEMGAARDTVATTKTEVEQEKRSVHVQLQDVTAKAEQLLAELALSKSKCYELERKNEDLNSAMGNLRLKVELGDVSAKSEQLVAELAEWKARCAKLEDDRTRLSEELKQAEARVNDVLETIGQEFADRMQSEEDEGKKVQIQLFSQNKKLEHTNSVLENDRRRLSQTLADMTKERDDFQKTVKAISDLLKEAEEEAEKQKGNYESRTRELSQKLKELDALRKRGTQLAEELGVIKLEADTYKEDFETERREREENASAMVEQKAKMELQCQYRKEEYETTLEANIQVSERLEKDVQILEKQLEEKANQVEATVKEKNCNDTKHQEEIRIATAKEDSLNDEIHNLTAKHQQLETQLKQQSDKLNGQIVQLGGELEVTCQHLAGARAKITGLEEELAGKTQQVKHYFKQVEDQKREITTLQREITTLQSQGQDQQQQYDILWGEADNSKQRVTNLRGQLQKRLEEIEQLHHEIDRLHQEQKEYVEYITAQQKSDMLNALSDKRDIMREKEQLKLELEHLKKWMQQAGFSVDPATGALPVPRKPHPPATDSVAMLPSRANQGSGPGRQQQYPPTTGSSVNEHFANMQGYYSAQPANAAGPSAMVGAQQGPPMQDRTQDRTQLGTNQPRGGNGLQSDSAGQDSLKNLLEAGITTDIHNVAAEFGEEYETSSLPDVPLDPNLVCPMCGLPFRIGEIQKYKRHVQQCKGSSGQN